MRETVNCRFTDAGHPGSWLHVDRDVVWGCVRHMVEAREWTEEFVAELYELNRYLVFRNLPTETGRVGGRADADVVAFRRREEEVEVCDVEVGTYYSGASAVARDLGLRFSRTRKGHVLDAVCCSIDPQKALAVRYRPIFVDASWSAGQFSELKGLLNDQGILAQKLEGLIQRAPYDVRRWQQLSTTQKGTQPQLPRSFKSLRIIQAAHWVWGWEKGWDAQIPDPGEPPFP